MLELLRYLSERGVTPQVMTQDRETVELLSQVGFPITIHTSFSDDYDVLLSEGVGGLESERVWLQESKKRGKLNFAVHNSMGVNPVIQNPYYTPDKAMYSDGVLTKDKKNAAYLERSNPNLRCIVTGAPEWDYRSSPQMKEETAKIRAEFGERFVVVCFHNATERELNAIADAIPVIDRLGYRFLLQPHPECLPTMPDILRPHSNTGQFHRYPLFAAASHAIVYSNSSTFGENIMANSKIAIWPIVAHRGKWGNHEWIDDQETFRKEALQTCGERLLGSVDILYGTPELEQFLADSTPKYDSTLIEDEFGIFPSPDYSSQLFEILEKNLDVPGDVQDIEKEVHPEVDPNLQEESSAYSKDVAIAIRIGSPKSKLDIVRNTLESIKEKIGACKWMVFISLGDRLNAEVRQYVESFVEAHSANYCIFQDGAYAWSDFINSAIDASSDYEYFIKSHDDIILHTDQFFPKTKAELQQIGREVGWISFTDVEYKRGAYAISTRPGYHKDFLAGASERRKLYQFHSLVDGWWNPPPGHDRTWINDYVDIPKHTVRVHAPLSHFVMIHRDTLKKIGKCQVWNTPEQLQFVMLNDEDWGLSALQQNLPNIWIPHIEYQHYHEKFIDGYLVETRCGPELAQVADMIHSFFREKWGFASKYTEGDQASIDCIRTRYKDTLIPWSLDTNSYDWEPVR